MDVVIVILGTTGVGKTKLSIELAKEFNGEVINADSMQVYKGLDIITNKAKAEERMDVTHHLFDFVKPSEEYSVTDFEKDALEKINDIHQRNKIPIIIGGTHYYIQSLLFNNLLISKNEVETPIELNKSQLENLKRVENTLNNPQTTQQEIYDLLCEVDKNTANNRHPNDERRNRRSLEIYLSNKIPQSEIIERQKKNGEKQSLRYRTCCFWLYSEKDVLNKRLDDRVDNMIKEGLFDEIKEMKKCYDELLLSCNSSNDTTTTNLFTKGIFQAIGFKEFGPYLEKLKSFNLIKDQPEVDQEITDELEKLKMEGIEKMKSSTRRYSNKQISWIKNKFIPKFIKEEEKDHTKARLYILDTTNIEQWKENITKNSKSITQAFIEKKETLNPRELNEISKKIYGELEMTIDENSKDLVQIKKRQRDSQWKKYECDICVSQTKGPRILNGLIEWESHKKSRIHRNNARKLKKEKEKEQQKKKEINI